MKNTIFRHPVTMIRACVVLSAILFVLGSAAARAAFVPEDLAYSIVSVETDRGKKSAGVASGFLVYADRYNGYVVTNAAVTSGAGVITVSHPRTGSPLGADILWSDLSGDFALLKVNGLNMPTLPFAMTEPEDGEVVWSAAKLGGTETVSVAKGLLRSSFELPGNGGWYKHTAGTLSTGGSVLLNECGQVLGLNFMEPASDGTTRAVDLASLQGYLAGQNLKFTVAGSACVSELTRARESASVAEEEARAARQEVEDAQQVVKDLERQLNATQKSNTGLEAQIRIARERSEAAIRSAEQAEARADNMRRDLEEKTQTLRVETQELLKGFEEDRLMSERRFEELLRAQQEAAAGRERIMIGFMGALLVLIAVMLYFTRARGAPAPAAAAGGSEGGRGNTSLNHRSELAEYVLDGRDDDGIRYLLRISGDQLVNHEDGVIIGRNPKDSPYIINHADVSRKHARIKVKNNRVFIEDLGSTNGTSVNGQSIDDKGPVSVDNGDQIIIGSVVMKLRVLDGG